MGLGMLRLEDEHLVELLRPLGAVLEHGAHSGVAVDVGVFPLDVGVDGVGERDVLIGLHQAGVHLPGPAALVAVEDVGLGGLDKAVVHQHPLHDILDVFHIRSCYALHLQHSDHLVGQRPGHVLLAGLVGCFEGFGNGSGNFILVKLHQASITFFQLFNRHVIFSLSQIGRTGRGVSATTVRPWHTLYLVSPCFLRTYI